MGKFATIKAGAITTTGSLVSIAPGVPFVLGGPSVGPNDAVTKNELDSLQATVNTMLDGSIDAYNSFKELKTFVDDCKEAGVTSLTEAVATEASDRSDADAAEASAREAAIDAEASAREAGDAAEALARSDADAAEALARSAGDAAEASARSAGDAAEALARSNADNMLKENIFKHIIVPLSTAVVPDESSPMVMPKATLNICSMDGWYFRNHGPTSASRKINWYLQSPLNSNGVATYQSLLEVGILVKLLSRQSLPFLTIYTKLKASGNSASWYNAKHTYICDNSVLTDVPVNERNFLLAVGVNKTSVGQFSGFRKVELNKDEYSSRGSILPDDEILAMSIGSDSSAAAGNVDFVLHSLICLSTNGNYSHLFSNNDVLQHFLLNKMDDVYASLEQTLPSSEIAW